jgi:hypothetical protein
MQQILMFSQLNEIRKGQFGDGTNVYVNNINEHCNKMYIF